MRRLCWGLMGGRVRVGWPRAAGLHFFAADRSTVGKSLVEPASYGCTEMNRHSNSARA
jgi:hypothetical protein